MVLVKNLKFFHVFIFAKIRQENVFDNILKKGKKAFLDSKIKKLKKPKIWYFFRGVTPWLWSKKFEFFSIFNLKRKIGQKNVFDDTIERREVF